MNELREELFLAVYWGPDQKTFQACVEDLFHFLILLKTYQPHFFGQWYGKGWSATEAYDQKINFTYDSIRTTLFHQKVQEESYQESGFTCAAWHDKESDRKSISLSASLGYGGTLFPNTLVLELPYEGAIREYYAKEHHQKALLKLMIDYWQADFVKVNDPAKKISSPYTTLNLPKESPIAVTRHRKITSSQEEGYLQQMVKGIKKLF